MLSVGQIFKLNTSNRLSLPNVQARTTRVTEINNVSSDIANYSKINSSPFIFKTFVQIDNEVAANLNLSYFKTCTINRRTNSYENQNLMTYAKLLNTEQQFDKNNFVSSLYITEKYNLLNRDNNLLGRNIRLSDVSTKSLIENFSHRKYDTKQFGVDLLVIDNQFVIKKYQTIFFEINKNLFVDNSFTGDVFDFIIFAYNSEDELLDVVKISDFRLDRIANWLIDTTTSSLISQDDLDDIFLSNLINLNFDQSQFTNLSRQVILSLTSLANSIDLKRYVQEIKICENDIEFINVNIDDLLNNPNVLKRFNTLYNNENEFSISFNYKTIIKSFDNKYFIFNTRYTGLKNFTSEISSDILIRNYLSDSRIQRIETNDRLFLKIDLNINNDLLKYTGINPKFIGMYLNQNIFENQNKISQLILDPNYYQNYDLNLNNVFLKSLINIENTNSTTFTFYYLKSENDSQNSITFQIEDNSRIYNVQIDESYTITNINPAYDQKLIISRSQTMHDENFSNLNVNISLRIRDWKNINSNLSDLINLGYENYINGTIDNIKFDNRIFLIVQKKFKNQGPSNIQKSGIKYFIFDQDDLNLSVNISDFSLNLKFTDNFNLNSLFLKSNQISDHLNLDTDIEYIFESKLLIIPRNFFTTSGLSTTIYTAEQIQAARDFKEKEEIYNILLQNTKTMHPQIKIDTIHKILSNINQNNFSMLNQLSLKILYDNYALLNTAANSSIILPRLSIEENENITTSILSFYKEDSHISFISKSNVKQMNITLCFVIDSQTGDTADFINSLTIPVVNNILAQAKILNNVQITKNSNFNSTFSQNRNINFDLVSEFVNKFNQNLSVPVINISDNILTLSINSTISSFSYELTELLRNLSSLSIQNVDLSFEISNYRSQKYEVKIKNPDECRLTVNVNDLLIL